MTRSRVERFLRLTGAWTEASIAREHRDAMLALARHNGVTVSGEELQNAVDLVREELGRLTTSEAEGWLADTGLELKDFEREVEADMLEDKLCDTLDRLAVEEEFQRQRIRFDSVRLRAVVVADVRHGGTLAERAKERGDLFDAASHGCSVGYRLESGWFTREELPEQAIGAVFRARPGDIVGPVQLGEDRYAVYCIDEIRPAVLDQHVERQIRTAMIAAKARMLRSDCFKPAS